MKVCRGCAAQWHCRPDHILKPRTWRLNARDGDLTVGIEAEGGQHHRVIALLQRYRLTAKAGAGGIAQVLHGPITGP